MKLSFIFRATTIVGLAASLGLTGCAKKDPVPGEDTGSVSAAPPPASPQAGPASDPEPAPGAEAPVSAVAQSSTTEPGTQASAIDAREPNSAEPVETTEALAARLGAKARQDLEEASSPYLREAGRQSVQWLAWGTESLELARVLDRPILLCIGAGWCHSCKSMDRDTYSDPAVAELINAGFIPVRVDRDERPDLDERYQAAYAAINRRPGGYPLTVFSLPDGRPFESVGYVAPRDNEGEVGMANVLGQVLDIYASRRADAAQMASAVEEIVARSGVDPSGKATPDLELLHKLQASIAREYDSRREVFGRKGQPHFPTPGAALALLHYYSDFDDRKALSTAVDSLSRYYRSGLRDNVLGGYFRYAADEDLKQPRFEKLLYVQAEMLRANAAAYAATGKYLYREATSDTLRFVRDTLESGEGAGFYASQDADLDTGDNGSYYTWTADEVRKVVGDGVEAKVFLRYLNVDEKSRTPSVLHPTSRMQSVAESLKISRQEAIKHLDYVQLLLHRSRMSQDRAPYVNKTLISSWNSAMISAYLDVYRYVGDVEAREYALNTANLIMEKMISPEHGVARRYYKGAAGGFGFLEDQVRLADALIHCFEVSGKHEYLETATSLMEFVEARFLDPASGLYFDRDEARPVGLLHVRRHALADGATPSANAVAAMNWYRLYQLSGKQEHYDRAERIVSVALGQKGLEGTAAATYLRALALLVNGAPKVVVVGNPEEEATQVMHKAALSVFRMGKLVEVLSPAEAAKTDYRPSKDGQAIAYVCTAAACAPPVRDPEKLPAVIKSFAKQVGTTEAAGAKASDKDAEEE